jgi:uncharacterized protein (TIGR03435 family)
MTKARVLLAVGIVALAANVASVLAAQTPASPAFEVASVKPSAPSATVGGSFGFQPGGAFRAVNWPVSMLIAVAFGTDRPLLVSQISGGPSWIGSDRFDIAATAGSALPSDVPSLSKYVPAMLRALLEDRFKLKTHTETRQQQIYALVKARTDGRLGPGLRESTVDCLALAQLRSDNPSTAPPLPSVCGIRFHPGSLSGSMTMSNLTSVVSTVVGIVADRTGLAGHFDVELHWSPGGPQADTASADALSPDAPSIFTAVQEQLGLKLNSEKSEGDVLVIDHVEHPSKD